ncbi:MAG: SDR family oxidoreductase [Acidobacteriota bacterium]|jgi:NAD(P)-dependent dehydrogenase (short-subunit alcohol dehydrogenase family)
MDLHGRKVLVTGAARRVGREIALAMARRGADLLVHYRSSAADAERTADEARSQGAMVVTLQADLSTAAGVAAMAREAIAAFGRVDVLVNNASIYKPTPMDGLDEGAWDEHMDINLKAPFLCALRLGRSMSRQGEGKIINLVDLAGERPYPGFLPYCVSKAGLIALTRGLALELAPKVQVNGISPGPVLDPEGFSREEIRAVPMKTPLRRMGSPGDVAAAAVFLVEGSDYITGSILPVDGGWQLAAR